MSRPSPRESSRTPTHICIDCGALGYAGGYHDHGNGNAGDTMSLEQLLKDARRGGAALDAVAVIKEALAQIDPHDPYKNYEAFAAHVESAVSEADHAR